MSDTTRAATGAELVGREDDLAALLALLADERHVTLLGPGGVGKTTLARAALAAADDAVATAFVDLTAADDDADVPSVAADHLDALDVTRWRAAHPAGAALVVLDNCEHVLDGAARLARTLATGSEATTVLATSRVTLELPDEHVLRLDPLPTEGVGSPAARMFAARAAARGATVAVDDPTVAALVEDLDGLPLAIELAAARAASSTPLEIRRQLAAGRDLGRRRGPGPARHRSLAATVVWSWELLDDELRAAVAALADFAGPFSPEMATAALGPGTSDPDGILADLVDRSLLRHQRRTDGSSFQMLDAVRTYARAQLEAAGRVDEVRSRVDGVVRRDLVALGAWPVLGRLDVPYLLHEAFATVRRVVERAVDDGDAAGALAMTRGFWILEDYGHRAESVRHADGLRLLDRVLALDRTPETDDDRGVALGVRSLLLRMSDRPAEAWEAAGEAIDLGPAAGRALGHRTRGHVLRRRSQWADAIAEYARGVTAATEIGERSLELEIEIHLALAMARSGALDEATAHIRVALERVGPLPIADALGRLFLSWILVVRDPVEARRLTEVVLATRPADRGDYWSDATASYQLGLLDLLAGRPTDAARHLHRSVDLFTRVRNDTDILFAILGAMGVFRARGREDLVALAARSMPTDPSIGAFEREHFLAAGVDVDDLPTSGLPVSPTALLDPLASIAIGGRPAAGVPPTSGDDRGGRFVRTGAVWEATFAGRTTTHRHVKGFTDLAELLRRPGVEVAALDLVGAGVVQGAALEHADAEARRAYEARLRDLAEEIEEARARQDLHRTEVLQEEFDTLVDHLGQAYGLGGRSRGSGEPAERARSTVTHRIRAAIERLGEHDPRLADHLRRAVRTGRFCVYDPETPVEWVL